MVLGGYSSQIYLAVNRRYKRDGEQEADFISCVTFGKSAEFAQKYLYKGMRIVIGGRISTGSYKDKDGKTIYTTDVIVGRTLNLPRTRITVLEQIHRKHRKQIRTDLWKHRRIPFERINGWRGCPLPGHPLSILQIKNYRYSNLTKS